MIVATQTYRPSGRSTAASQNKEEELASPLLKMRPSPKRSLELDYSSPLLKKRRRSEDPSPHMKKSVSFAESAQYQQFADEASKEEKQNCWYKREEYRSIQEDIQTTALSVYLGVSDLIQSEEFCIRGLEANLSPKVGKSRLLRRQIVVESVLFEQRTQKMQGIQDPYTIGELSQLLSSDASQEALQLAVLDAQL
jgi:hypothetical protein